MKTLRLFLSVTVNSFSETVRHRFFTLFCVFAFTAIYASVLAGMMAVDQEGRVLADIGLALMELTALAYVLFQSSLSLLKEAETKNIYLVFSRPVPRWLYLAGKQAGVMLTAAFMLAVMGLMHALLLKLRGFGLPAFYGWALAGSFMKLAVITSFAFFVSLFSTSSVSTLVISGILWTLAHFTSEVRFLADASGGFRGAALKVFAFLVPNFQLFNARDLAGAGAAITFTAFLAGLAWMLAFYLASLWLLSRKEF